MMKIPLAALALSSLLALQATPEPREGNRMFPRKLRGVPVGILVLHHPDLCYPVRKGGGFVWKHDTTVQSLVGDLTLVEYGAYIYTDAGWRLRATMTPNDFAKIYRCPGGKLRKDRIYADPDNARYGDKPAAGDALWFFLAKDGRGRRFKGTALVETEGLRPNAEASRSANSGSRRAWRSPTPSAGRRSHAGP